VINPASLPVEIEVEDYFPNSQPLGPMQDGQGAVQQATAGLNKSVRILPQSKTPGTDEAQDMASALVTVRTGARVLGTYLVSQWHSEMPKLIGAEPIQIDGRTFDLDLRFRRYYKPFAITLTKFSHDRYPGTDEPSNFASLVRLQDPDRHVDREVRIWMNHPLTYGGETFYQQNFRNNDHTTVLQVASNPAWPMPYIGLALGFVGMLIHFGIILTNFLRRRLVQTPAPVVPPRRGRNAAATSYTLEPQSNLVGWSAAIVTGMLGILIVIGLAASTANDENGFDLAGFGALPVMSGGRVMPLDTLARTDLRIISNRETFKDSDGKTHPAIRWLLDTMLEKQASDGYKVIRLDYPDIITQLGLDAGQKYFSLSDFKPHWETFAKQASMASEVPDKQRDLYQQRIAELGQHIEVYAGVRRLDHLMVVPPAKEHGDWPVLFTGDSIAQGGEPFASILRAYADGRAGDFNAELAAYHATLSQQLPDSMAKVDFESFFNKLEPFYICLWFYLLVFMLACFSWLGWRKPLWSAAMGLLVVTLMVHTFGMISRVYLTGRGPITNLYASALFIGWGIALLAIVLELIFRNGLGAAVASIAGFATLLVAHSLGNDGDTMKPVVAVLATNFWLWTHVPCVGLGYASTFFSGLLAIAYVLLGIFTRVLDADNRKSLARMVYGITCFAILFSFVGTILGGIWADYSWGRFWGWDPKENGAILIVLWNAVILHARWGGMVKERGMMLLAIGGNIVTSWSWFGTNLMGIGLHSYGFMDGAATTLVWFWASQIVLIGVGLVPTTMWRGLGDVGVAKVPVPAI
jgi:ABC-type transport system involved in cytochrome c biogenesis permease subunit